MTQFTEEDTDSVVRLQHPFWALVLKHFFDVFFAFSMLIFIWPVLLILALLVRFSTPGPVFYRGIRSGLHGRSFRILKFRTMVEDAESLGGPTTGSNDVRVTSIGSFLRRTKLDELPQFINILFGEMSLVGPRPEVPEYTRLYKGEEELILSMKPGITDYASIKYADLDDRVGNLDPDAYFREHVLPSKNKLRVRYVKEWSISGDFIILGLTFMRVLGKICKL